MARHGCCVSPSPRRLVVLLLAASASARLIAATVTAEGACRHTKHPAFCVKALSARPESKTAADPLALAELSLSLAAESAAETVSFLENLEKTPGGVPCVGKLRAAVAGLRLSRAALGEHGDVAGVSASVARADGETCLDGCQKAEGGADPRFADKICELGKLCSIALALTNAATRSRTA